MGSELASTASALDRWQVAFDLPQPLACCAASKHTSARTPGVATSRDGLRWARGAGDVMGARGAAKDADVGRVLAPNADWWWHDTRHMAVSDVQARPALGPGAQPARAQCRSCHTQCSCSGASRRKAARLEARPPRTRCSRWGLTTDDKQEP